MQMTKRGPVAAVTLAHPTHLPVYKKVQRYARHPREGPPIALITGGSGARKLSETLIRYSHHTSHILPVFDDGGSSRALRKAFRMLPPGDLRNRLMALSDMTREGNPEVSTLFRTRLAAEGTPAALRAELETYLSGEHSQMARIEPRYRRIIIKHLERFAAYKPEGFDLRRGNIGNFVITGAYLAVGNLESVLFELSALAAVRGEVIPVCLGEDYNLRATLTDGSQMVGQSRITTKDHPPIRSLEIVEPEGDGWRACRPQINPLAEQALHRAALIAYSMGSFYTSLLANLLVDGAGQAIREATRPKVFVANLVRDAETREMTVSRMLEQLCESLRSSDSQPGEMRDYVHYALVSSHGDSADDGHLPVDIERIRSLGVEPIVLPLETQPGVHDPELVAAVLLSLC